MKFQSMQSTSDTGTQSEPALTCASWNETALFEGLIYNHFETEMLMACHSVITKYLPQPFLQRANP